MSVKNWSYCYKENKETLTVKWIVDTISLAFAVGLLWYTFFQILDEYFPLYAQVDGVCLFVFALLLWAVTNKLFTPLGARFEKIIHIVTILLPVGYGWKYFSNMGEGILAVANDFLELFNPYQGTGWTLPPGDEGSAKYVLTLLYAVVWMGLWGIAIVMVLLPIAGIALDFVVGRSPSEEYVLYIFIAAMLLIIPQGTKVLRRIAVVVLALVCLNVSSYVYEEDIGELADGKDVIQNWWENFELPDFGFAQLPQVDYIVDNERVDNYDPSYKGIVIFEIDSDERPTGVQYFRGFCATDYADGVWKWDRTTFRRACEKKGYDEVAIAQMIARNPFLILSQTTTYNKMTNKVSMEYLGVTGNKVYVPYIFSWNSMDESYKLTGDYLLQKEASDKDVSVRVGTLGDLTDLSVFTHYARYNDSYAVMQWYNSVAQNYIKRSENLECINLGAEYVAAKAKRLTLVDLWTRDEVIRYDEESVDAVLENMYRMEVASWVSQYLALTMDYSLKLDHIDSKTDPIEYALTQSKEGYCMHYASAAVLMFKELGIPARYATGYIVRPSDYKLNGKTGNYVARVEDYNAHAWAEIYLEDIGWVPIEVTEGYGDPRAELPSKKEPGETSETLPTETGTTEEPTEEPTTEDPTEEPTTEEPTEEPTEDPTEEPTEKPTEAPGETQSSEETPSETGPGGVMPGSKDYQKLWAIIITVTVAVAGVFGVICAIKATVAYYEHILQKEIDGKQTRQAVKRMNKRISRMIRITNRKNGQLTDARLEVLLKEKYPKIAEDDWTRYMEIVKKMHYSREKITEDEMMHVYWCYKNK